MTEKEQPSVTMRVRIGDNELEVTGPIDFVEKKIAEFREQQKTIHPLSPSTTHLNPPTQPSPISVKGMSVAQFFKKISPKSDIDRTLAAGYYLEKMKNEEKFTSIEVSETIRSAKTTPPKNPSDCVSKNIRKGYMMAAGDKDGKMAFVLTSDGEEAIEALLNA